MPSVYGGQSSVTVDVLVVLIDVLVVVGLLEVLEVVETGNGGGVW